MSQPPLNPDFYQMTVLRYDLEKGNFRVLIDNEDRIPGTEQTVPLFVMNALTGMFSVDEIVEKRDFKLQVPDPKAT